MIYFDNAASSFPKPPAVSRAVGQWLKSNGANPGRSGHKPALDAGGVIFDTRLLVCDIFGRFRSRKRGFVPNATYGLNF